MTTGIYYLSGTGNSLHVAKELQKRIPDTELIPLAGIKNTEGIKTEAEAVGFVKDWMSWKQHFKKNWIFFRIS